MVRERIKNCLLTFLVISSIVLTFNMWVDGKLWPDGYNFFSNIKNLVNTNSSKSYYLSKENISNPQKIIINNIEKRSLYSTTSPEYDEVVPHILDTFKTALHDASFTPSNQDEYNGAMQKKSAYISYPVIYDYNLLCGILDIENSLIKVKSVKDCIISVSEKNDKTLNVYIKDYSSGNIQKANISYNFDKILQIVEKYAINSINQLPYSFELNFDKNDTNQVEQKIVFEPNVTLRLDSKSLPQLESVNYFKNIYDNYDLTVKLLNAFNYNTTITNKYLDTNNTAVYVENFSTIKVHDNGLLEYKAIDNTKGISVSTQDASLYDTFIACIEFVNNLWDSTFPHESLNINLTSDIQSLDKKFTITMDYYAQGHLAISHIDANERHNELNHGIEITVSDGKIVEYRQLFTGFKATSKKYEGGTAIEAIDKLFADNSIENVVLSDINLVYTNDEKIWLPSWAVKTKAGELIVIRK